MSKDLKSGWGFSKNNIAIDMSQQGNKRTQAIWEQANENVIVIPDAEADSVANQLSDNVATNLVSHKVKDFYDLQVETRKSTLPSAEEGVDLGILLSFMRTNDEVNEADEPWEFGKLKTEVYEVVSKLNENMF